MDFVFPLARVLRIPTEDPTQDGLCAVQRVDDAELTAGSVDHFRHNRRFAIVATGGTRAGGANRHVDMDVAVECRRETGENEMPGTGAAADRWILRVSQP